MKKPKPKKRVIRRTGLYSVSHDNTTEVYTRIQADRISIMLRNGNEMRVSLSKHRPAIEVYTTDGRLFVLPDVSNVITVGVEEN